MRAAAREQIKRLMDPLRGKFAQATTPQDKTSAASGSSSGPASSALGTATAAASARPMVPAAIREQFAAIVERVPAGYALEYRPALVGRGKVHFVQAASNIEQWREERLIATLHNGSPDDVWAGAELAQDDLETGDAPDERVRFAELPGELAREKSYAIFTRQLKEHLYRESSLKLWQCAALDQTSQVDETNDAFRVRVAPLATQKLASEREKLNGQYAGKLARLEAALERRQVSLRTQRLQFWSKLTGVVWVAVDTVLRATGRGKLGRSRSAEVVIRQAATERGQQQSAQLGVEQARQEKQRLEDELQSKLQALEAQYAPGALSIEPLQLSPRKGDIDVDEVSLLWLPWRVDAAGRAEAVY